MGLGVLDDTRLQHVPATIQWLRGQAGSPWLIQTGTSTLDDVEQRTHSGTRDPNLKYSSGPDPVILVPQPSNDPNDPLVRLRICSTSEVKIAADKA
ncbi:hypothetical protein LTR66_004292 [Elasticomyces elasticus]|nr:hypothetical protein LTR66_004292 [Elasticomyces elasticus]